MTRKRQTRLLLVFFLFLLALQEEEHGEGEEDQKSDDATDDSSDDGREVALTTRRVFFSTVVRVRISVRARRRSRDVSDEVRRGELEKAGNMHVRKWSRFSALGIRAYLGPGTKLTCPGTT